MIGFDITELSPKNVKKADKLLESFYADRKAGKIDDYTAAVVGDIFESEPIHHLMSVSIYPLADLSNYLHQKDGKGIKKLKSIP